MGQAEFVPGAVMSTGPSLSRGGTGGVVLSPALRPTRPLQVVDASVDGGR
jgi:hypothetical protein